MELGMLYNVCTSMVKKPFFSIVIPTYNRASDLQFALYCLFQQTFTNFEIIISDNFSTDCTKEFFGNLNDKRIRYFRNNTNLDFALNVQKAVNHARGEYVFLHSDDDFLLFPYSLKAIYKEIKKHNAGYIRVNYMCLGPDKKSFFYFKANKPFVKNEYLRPFSESKKVVNFIFDSDSYFITGIIFKNNLPSTIKIIDADPSPWVRILFYSVKNFGGYFINEPHIVANWSTWRSGKNGKNPLYSLTNGKLKPEKFFKVVEQKLGRKDYSIFLHKQLMLIYVIFFPVIKVNVGNKNLLAITLRILKLDSTMKKNLIFWMYITSALILPEGFLKFVKNISLFLYMRFSKVENVSQIIIRLKELESGFSRS